MEMVVIGAILSGTLSQIYLIAKYMRMIHAEMKSIRESLEKDSQKKY